MLYERVSSIAPTGCLVVVDIDALQLQVGVAAVGACGVDAVLVRYHLPELAMRMCNGLEEYV